MNAPSRPPLSIASMTADMIAAPRGPCASSVHTKGNLTHARLTEVLSYDPSTGLFQWNKSNSNCVRAGSRAAATPDIAGYHRIMVDTVRYRAHVLAWFYVYQQWPDAEVDHKDGNPSNNAIDNLRLATRSQQNMNRRRTGATGFKGVYRKRQRFGASIQKNRRIYHLGYFATPEEAHAAYTTKAKEFFGDFARLS